MSRSASATSRRAIPAPEEEDPAHPESLHHGTSEASDVQFVGKRGTLPKCVASRKLGAAISMMEGAGLKIKKLKMTRKFRR